MKFFLLAAWVPAFALAGGSNTGVAPGSRDVAGASVSELARSDIVKLSLRRSTKNDNFSAFSGPPPCAAGACSPTDRGQCPRVPSVCNLTGVPQIDYFYTFPRRAPPSIASP